MGREPLCQQTVVRHGEQVGKRDKIPRSTRLLGGDVALRDLRARAKEVLKLPQE